MRNIKIIITGKEVHDVGYRSVLLDRALEIGINRFNTFNTSRDDLQAVIVLIEGDEEQLNDFMDFVRTKRPERAVVSGIIDEEYGKTVPPIERCIQSFQMGQWVEGIPILLDIRDVLQSVKGDTGKMLEKQDKMLEKQDETIKEIKKVGDKVDVVSEKVDLVGEEVKKVGEKVDTVGDKVDVVSEKVDLVGEEVKKVGEKVDTVGDKVDQSRVENVEEIRALKHEALSYSEKRFDMLTEDVKEIKQALKREGILP